MRLAADRDGQLLTGPQPAAFAADLSYKRLNGMFAFIGIIIRGYFPVMLRTGSIPKFVMDTGSNAWCSIVATLSSAVVLVACGNIIQAFRQAVGRFSSWLGRLSEVGKNAPAAGSDGPGDGQGIFLHRADFADKRQGPFRVVK